MRCQPLGVVGLGVGRGRRDLGEERSRLPEVEQGGLLQHRRRPAALAARGVGNSSFEPAARTFLTRWPYPQGWASQPLRTRLSSNAATRPLLTYLMLAGQLRPGYDYLLERKLPSLLREAQASPLGPDLAGFLTAAAELGYSRQVAAGMASQVAMRAAPALSA